MQTGELPPTATYAVREWRWVPADPGAEVLGELTIVLQRHARNGRAKPTAVESDTYAVQHDTPPVGGPGRAYLLLNLTDPDQADVYRVVIGPYPSGDTCSCPAGRVDLGRKRRAAGELTCKHRSPIRQIIEQGGLLS
jgi:hypothetical protein